MMANSTMANSVVEDLYNNSPHKIWIKRIPDDNNLHIDNYPYTWRKKWKNVWDKVKYCTRRCRENKVTNK